MVSKLQQHHDEDMAKYLVDIGLSHNMLSLGFIATIRTVEKKTLKSFLPCGEVRRIWFQLELPEPKANALMLKWKKIFHRAQRKSAWVRFLGCTSQYADEKTVWTLNEESIVLEQCNILDGSDIRLFESYCGSVWGMV